MKVLAADATPDLTFPWLLRLRWVAVGAQVVALLGVVLVLHQPVAEDALSLLVGAIALSNLALLRWMDLGGKPGRAHIATTLLVDTLLLTGLLHYTGGPSNPFCVLYLLQVTLGALLLGPLWTWILTILGAACYALLFLSFVPLSVLSSHTHGGPLLGEHLQPEGMSLHLQGMWVAFVVGSLFMAWFLAQLSAAVRDRDAELAAWQLESARREKLTSLTTLAAGAAHELGTPLATIALIAEEWEEEATLQGETGRALAADARLIRNQLERCKQIVTEMNATAGTYAGEMPENLALPALLERVVADLSPDRASRLRRGGIPVSAVVLVPPRTAVQVVKNIVNNGFDASGPDETVSISARLHGGRVRLLIEDTGQGMDEETLHRAGEPFFTTKVPGQGMGLGLYLAREFALRLGGELRLQSRPGSGTQVTLELPLGAPPLETP